MHHKYLKYFWLCEGIVGARYIHWCQLKLKRLSHSLFTPPLNPLPALRGGEKSSPLPAGLRCTHKCYLQAFQAL
jgi:hypothetical protein